MCPKQDPVDNKRRYLHLDNMHMHDSLEEHVRKNTSLAYSQDHTSWLHYNASTVVLLPPPPTDAVEKVGGRVGQTSLQAR